MGFDSLASGFGFDISDISSESLAKMIYDDERFFLLLKGFAKKYQVNVEFSGYRFELDGPRGRKELTIDDLRLIYESNSGHFNFQRFIFDYLTGLCHEVGIEYRFEDYSMPGGIGI